MKFFLKFEDAAKFEDCMFETEKVKLITEDVREFKISVNESNEVIVETEYIEIIESNTNAVVLY